jgi:hypothetical protein
MKTQKLNTEEAPNKWWAARDARQRSLNNQSHYSSKEQVRAERMKLALELVYSASGVYIAYGRRGISVKVNGARVRDRQNLTVLETDWTAEGITKRITPQGVIYRI